MSIEIIQDKLKSYSVKSKLHEEYALKEISQEIALLALSQAGFFKVAAFQGGTSLRILYNLPRFSEDLDFVLMEKDPDFTWEPYFKALEDTFESFGLHLEVSDRSKANDVVKKAFIKEDSFGKVLTLQHSRNRGDLKKLSIKFEVDTNPPEGAVYDTVFHTFPYPFSITAHDLPSLFAGKLHALLCRDHVKGRDWYDYIWYKSRKTEVNYTLLQHALQQEGPWKGEGTLKVDQEWLNTELHRKISSIDFEVAKQDVERFLPDVQLPSLQVWSQAFFTSLSAKGP